MMMPPKSEVWEVVEIGCISFVLRLASKRTALLNWFVAERELLWSMVTKKEEENQNDLFRRWCFAVCKPCL